MAITHKNTRKERFTAGVNGRSCIVTRDEAYLVNLHESTLTDMLFREIKLWQVFIANEGQKKLNDFRLTILYILERTIRKLKNQSD